MAIEPSTIEAAGTKPKSFQDAAGNKVENRPISDLIEAANYTDQLTAKRARTTSFQKFKFGSKA
jgi:hypothetical protein